MKQKIQILKKRLFQTDRAKYLSHIESYQYLPLTQKALLSYESKNDIELSKSYRTYLLTIANGGQGPDAGIKTLSLENTIQEINENWVDPIAYNAVYQIDWDNPSNQRNFEDQPLTDNERKLRKSSEKGCIHIASRGCGLSTILVVSGPNKGEIWYDNTANDEGFEFKDSDFSIWYNEWLDAKIITLNKTHLKLQLQLLDVDSISKQSLPDDPLTIYGYINALTGNGSHKKISNFLNTYLNKTDLPNSIRSIFIEKCLNNPAFLNYQMALAFLKHIFASIKDEDATTIKNYHCLMGQAFVKMKRYTEAILSFNIALNIDVKFYPKGHLKNEYACLLSYAYYVLKKDEEAIKAILPPHPSHGLHNAFQLMDDLCKIHGLPQTALELAERLLKWEPEPITDDFYDEDEDEYLEDLYLHLITINAYLGNTAAIEKNIEQLVALGVQRESILDENIANNLYNAKFHKEALVYLENYEKSERSQYSPQWLHNLRGCCYMELEQYEESNQHLKRSFDFSHWIVPLCNQIRNYIHLGEEEKALDIYNQIIEFDPNHSWAYYQIAVLHIKKGESNKAIELIKKVIDLGFDKKIIKEDNELQSILEFL